MGISAIIPARNEERTIAGVVSAVLNDVDEVIVVDSYSTDKTGDEALKAGARVVKTNIPGKHQAIRLGIIKAKGSDLIFLDADLEFIKPNIARVLIDSLHSSNTVSIAKGFYTKRNGSNPNDGGRVTELCVRPLINLLFPRLSSIRDPLTGEYAVKKKDIEYMYFDPGFAVDLGILLQCMEIGEVRQVDLGVKYHKHRDQSELVATSVEVATTIIRATGLGLIDITQKRFTDRFGIESEISLERLPPIKTPKYVGYK